jgi:hypothetical protein
MFLHDKAPDHEYGNTGDCDVRPGLGRIVASHCRTPASY